MLSGSLAVQEGLQNPVTRDKLVSLVQSAVVSITGTVETGMLENGAASTPKIADAAVTNPKIADAAVTTPKIADGSVTAAKLVGSDAAVLLARNAQCVASTAIQASSTAQQWVDVTGLSVSVTLRSEASKVLLLGSLALSGDYGVARLVRNGEVLLQGDADGTRTRAWGSTLHGDGCHVPFNWIDAPGSVGPHVYKIQFMASAAVEARVNRAKSSYDSNSVNNACLASSLVVIELFMMP